MSDTTHSITIEDRPRLAPGLLKGWQTGFLVAGVVLLALTALGAYFNPKQFAHSWLFSFDYFLTVAAGGLFWTMIHHATNGGWGTLVRRQLENLASVLPWVALLFLGVFFSRHQLYPQLSPENLVADALFQSKKAYFTLPGTFDNSFFYLRAAFYFSFFIWAAWFFRSFSIRQDETGYPTHTTLMQKWSFAAIPGFGISLTFYAVDYLMGLDFKWYSTMWGVYIFAGTAGSGMAMLALILLWLKGLGYLPKVNQEHFHIVGKLMFAFTIFWSYIAFSQYMLIWYANIPEETIFFKVHTNGSWYFVTLFLIIGHFVIPFLSLLTQWVKKSPKALGIVAGWMLFIHAVDHYWIVMPNLHQSWSPHWMDVTAWLGMAGLLISVFLGKVQSANLYPIRDPRLSESVELKN